MNAASIRLGLPACDMGVRLFLSRLVSEVVGDDQLDAAAQSYLDDMLAASPVGLRMSKEGLNMAVDDRVSS